MANWANYVGSLHVPQIVQVDESEEWLVRRNGEWIACSFESVALANAELYRSQGYTDVEIEHRTVPIMGEVLP